MKTQLSKVLETLQKLLEKAEDLSGSDNENTADKYSDVLGNLENAIGEITDAIERLGG